MISNKNLTRYGMLLLGICLMLGLLILTIVPIARAARAENILKNVYTLSLPNNIQGKYVVHSQFLTYQRVDPNRKEAEDPYHRSILDRYSGTVEVDQWILVQDGKIIQARSTERDANSQLVLYDRIFDGQRNLLYNGREGYASILPLLQSTPFDVMAKQSESLPEFAHSRGLKLSTVANSSWNKPAWVVQHKEENLSDARLAQLSAPAAPIPSNGPYFADLDVVGFLATWVVDQETERMVSHEWQATTPAGPVLLKRTEHRAPEILSPDVLPSDWLDFSLESIPVLEDSQPVVPSAVNMITTLDEAVNVADFQVFLPVIPESSGLTRTDVFYKSKAKPKEVWQRSWVFDIQDASRHGLALEVIYLFNIDTSSDGAPYALAIIQGPSDRLVPLMRETNPIWTESHPVQLTIVGQEITAWVAVGGRLADPPPEQIVVMLEIDNTFVFVVGQGYAEQQVLDVIGTLHPVEF